MTKEYPFGKGTPRISYDGALNDSDKTIYTVPAGKIAVVHLVDSQLTNTATVGSRLHTITITDGANLIASTGTTSTASQTSRARLIPGTYFNTSATRQLTTPTANVNAAVTDGLPASGLILTAGCVVRVYDSAAIDVAADDLVTVIVYVEYDA